MLCTYAGISYGDYAIIQWGLHNPVASVLHAITLRRGAQSLFSIIVYSNTSEATENITRRLSLRLLKGSLSEHFQAVTANEVTRLAR